MVDSPCINICILDSDKDLCIGCYRTAEEISKWSFLSNFEKKEVLLRIKSRSTYLDTKTLLKKIG
jgi:uncharacterized protein